MSRGARPLLAGKNGTPSTFLSLAFGRSQVGERQPYRVFFSKVTSTSLIVVDPVDFFLVIFHFVTRASLATAGSEGRDCWGSICVPHPERTVRPRAGGGERGGQALAAFPSLLHWFQLVRTDGTERYETDGAAKRRDEERIAPRGPKDAVKEVRQGMGWVSLRALGNSLRVQSARERPFRLPTEGRR